MPRHTRFTLSALVDAFPLAAQQFDPPPDVPVRAAVVISCATGIHAGFYRDFALYAMLFYRGFVRAALKLSCQLACEPRSRDYHV